jgi:hypothetical protein
MKKHWILCIAMLALSAFAVAQVAAGGSTSAGASVTPGQANANVNSNQSVQAGGASASANTNTAGSAQVSHQNEPKKDSAKHEHSATSGAASGATGSAGAGNASAALNSASSLQAELSKPLDAGKCKPGDEVTAKLTQDFKSDGKVVYHKGSKLIGHVTEAQAHTKDHAESKLGVVFDKVQPKGGEEASIHAVVQAVAPPARGMLDSSANQGLSAPAMGGSHGGGGGGGGLVGGVAGSATSTLGGVAGTAGNAAGGVAGGVTSNVGSTVNGAAGGLTAQGTLTNASRGVIGMQGLSLNSVTGATADASVISSATRTVKLESGTQMLLQLSSAASAK